MPWYYSRASPAPRVRDRLKSSKNRSKEIGQKTTEKNKKLLKSPKNCQKNLFCLCDLYTNTQTVHTYELCVFFIFPKNMYCL